MKIEFYNSLSSMEDKECIEKYLTYNASLVIAGAKPSATLTLKKDKNGFYQKWSSYGKDFLESINLKYINLRETENALILLIYCEETLKKNIFIKENKQFLMKLGYDIEESVESYVKMLKKRYGKYNCPHELGIFLGFPLDDVRDFIQCSDKKCLACGYWLVYNDIDKAQEIFSKYDQIKDFTIKSLLENKSLILIKNSIVNLAIRSECRA